jgi:hypothetical protein
LGNAERGCEPLARSSASLLRRDREGEDYEDFARRAAANPIGRNVKLADLADNCDLSRIAEPTEVDYRRIEKYRRATKLIHAL